MAKHKLLNYKSQVRTLALKFYVEQLMPADVRTLYVQLWKKRNTDSHASENCYKLEMQYKNMLIAKIRTFNYKDYCVLGIYHDQDTTESDGSPFLPSIEKGHFHILIWRDDWRHPKERFRVGTICNALGLTYAPALDTDIWKRNGAEIIESSVANYATYLTHDTEEAILDGKHKYNMSDLFANFDIKVVEIMHKFYQKTRKKTNIDWDLLDDQAYDLGYKVKDYDDFIRAKLSVSQRANANARILHQDYELGLERGIEAMPAFPRCSILIWGEGNTGKTYTTRKTLQALGLSIYQVPSGSGHYDGLRATHDAMTFDDVNVTDPLLVFDDKAVILHRRNSGDRPWVGRWAVVTTNDDYDLALRRMLGIYRHQYTADEKILEESDKRKVDALKKRFYICHIDPMTKKLINDSAHYRGSDQDNDDHDVMFAKFKKIFDQQLQNYDFTGNLENADDWKVRINVKYAKKRVERLGEDAVDERTLALSRLKDNEYDTISGLLWDGFLHNLSTGEETTVYIRDNDEIYSIPNLILRENLKNYGRMLTKNVALLYKNKMNIFYNNRKDCSDLKVKAI